MTRVLLGLGQTLGVLAVLALSSISPEPVSAASGPGQGRVISVAQKQKAKKKARPKKGAGKNDTTDGETPAPKAEPPAPSDGSLKFSKDIAPIIVNNCLGCHNARQKRGKLDMSTFEKMMEGTPSEKVITAGKPDESHLVLRIKGEETPKMPQGANRNLSEAAIARIEEWVKAGAVLDKGIDPKAAMESYASSPEDLRRADLAKMTPDQRDKLVESVGKERWKKASPMTTPEIASSAHFILFSTLPKDRAASTVKAVEGQYATVKGLLGPASVEWGEKASLFVFNDKGSFTEFVRANENREVDAGDVGTGRFTGAEPYVAVIDPSGGHEESASATPTKKVGRSRKDEDSASGERTVAGLLSEQFVIAAASKGGKPPRWLTLGLGALVAGKVEGRTGYTAKLHKDARELFELGWASKAQDALGDATKVEEVRAVGYAILEWLNSVDKSVVPQFVSGMMAGGDKLDIVIENVLNGTREQFLAGSGEFVGSRGGR